MKNTEIVIPFCGIEIHIRKSIAEVIHDHIKKHFNGPVVRLAADKDGDLNVFESVCVVDEDEYWKPCVDVVDGKKVQTRMRLVKRNAVEFDVADYEWISAVSVYGKEQFLAILKGEKYAH